jgi:cytochrome b
MKPVYVWTLPTRIFHWLLVLFITAAFVSAEEDAWLLWHVAFGFAAGVLVLYRVVWGFAGPEHSHFRDFDLNPASLKRYLLTLFKPARHYVGHNPAASFALVGIIAVTMLLALSGLLTYGIQEDRGLFAFLHGTFFREMELFEELHEALGTLLYLLIAAHVGGVLFDRLLHPSEGTLGSIFNGYKNLEGAGARLNLFQKLLAVVGIGAALAALVYLLAVRDNPLTASHHAAVDYEKAHPLFVNECASCHTLYPPSLLPEKSWRLMMADLQNHFGDDASLEAADNASILEYLAANAAERSTSEASVKILQSMPNQDMIAITQTPFWKRTHRGIAPSVFEQRKVKSRANCKACHGDVERGLIEDTAIAVPKPRS